MKRRIASVLSAAILFSTIITCPAHAVSPKLTPEEAGTQLQMLGVYQGDGSGDLMLDKGLTRAELAAILTRAPWGGAGGSQSIHLGLLL